MALSTISGQWENSPLGQLVTAKYGKSLPGKSRQPGSVPVFGSNGIVGTHSEALTSGPTIIIGRKGSSGEVNFSPTACWPIDTTYYVDDPGPFTFPFLYQLLRTLGLKELDRSTAIPGLNREELYGIVVPVPHVDEQRLIVERLDEIEHLGGAAAGSIARARSVMTSFRQAILAAACSGRLTGSWRERNSLSPVGTLLYDLRSELANSRQRGKVAPPNGNDLLELPDTWAWASLGEVADVQVGGTPTRKELNYWGGAIPWVSSGEVANCRISLTRENITEAGLAKSSAKLYPRGTVLIAMIGEGKTRGQAAILETEATTNQNVAGILPNRDLVDPEYLWRWALAQYEVTRAAGRGGNQSALNAQKVRELAIPIPPLPEQREIVRRVDELLKISEEVVAKIDATSSLLDRTSQAVLAKAFRGELVETVG